MVLWDDTAPHTITIDGFYFLSTHAGIYIGTEDNPIINKAKVIMKNTPSLGTVRYSGFGSVNLGLNYYGGGETYCFHGTAPTKRYANLVVDAEIGQKKLTVDNATGFETGDYVYVGKHDATYTSGLNATRYTIDYVDGNDIYLTTNLAGERRLGMLL